MNIKCIKSGLMDNNTYVLIDENSGTGVIIDPAKHNRPLLELIEGSDCRFKYIILTHGHFDHVWDAGKIKDITGAEIVIHKGDAKNLAAELEKAKTPYAADILLSGGETLECGGIQLKIMHTPGHTSGGICIICEDSIFTGDTLFKDTIGRTDLGGNPSEMACSLKTIKNLEGDYTVFPGHGDSTTLSGERAYNRYLCFYGL